ncbi:hypothetical protein ACFLZT_07815 [Thermodesulfobacteriota bacterium]
MTADFLVIDSHNHFVPGEATNYVFSKDRNNDNKGPMLPRPVLEKAGPGRIECLLGKGQE